MRHCHNYVVRRLVWTITSAVSLVFVTSLLNAVRLTSAHDCGEPKAVQVIEVSIHSGAIRGERLLIPSIGGDFFHVFKGIPYAAPPVGALRFQQPVEPAHWRGVMNATTMPMPCAQNAELYKNNTIGAFNRRFKKTEDCLYLNVFAPAQLGNETFPVLFWIHGGGFQIGSSNDYRCEPILRNFVSRRVIFITFNYRLGPLGFLASGDDVLPGNNGMWDQLAALKWAYRNVGQFGGDKNRITLIGQGSGAAAASILGLSPRAEGYFRNIILLSGTALTPGMVRETAIQATWKLQEYLGCNAFNSSQLFECLRTRPRAEIMDDNRPRVSYDDYQEWVPIVDGYGGLIPEHPEILATYRPRVAALIGTVRDESALHLLIFGKNNVNMSGLTKDSAMQLVKNLTEGHEGFTNNQLIAEGCNYEYVYTRSDPSMQAEVLRDSILDLYSHFWYHAPASRLATFYNSTGITAYLCSFDHVSEILFPADTDWRGAYHGADLAMLFEFDLHFLESSTSESWPIDRRVTEIFADLLTNFAQHNNPTPPGSGYYPWDPFQLVKLNYYSITDNPSNQVGFHWRGHIFWNQYAKYLDNTDVGNLRFISALRSELGDYQMATWILLCCALFFFAILVGLACYCTRRDPDDDM